MRKRDKIREYYALHPSASFIEVMEATKTSRRTVSYTRAAMVEEGLLPEHRRSNAKEDPMPKKAKEKPIDIVDATNIMIGGKTLADLAEGNTFDEEIVEDEVTQKQLLAEVRKLALGTGVHPDTRLSAITVWTKLKDMAKLKDLGPGPPRTENDIVIRLVRLMQGCGPKLVMQAIDTAFNTESKKGDSLEQAPNEQTTTPIGTTEAPNQT